ncbi:MAG: MBL fold metallo-hydrolase [Clostridiales bacterium]|nr:MBL fold metallo-hydrolase [Clostridiales bacterium]
MKSKKKRYIFLAIVILVLVAAEIIVQPVRALLAITSMRPLDTQEVIPGVFAVKNSYVNLYLLKNDGEYIAFDAGSNIKATRAALSGLGITESDITAVFLTHTDYDHVASLPCFSSAEIYMAQSNKEFLENSPGRSKAFIDMEKPYNTLADGGSVTVANTQMQCVFTPGHTDGSACYIVNGKYLFSGDNLSLKDGRAGLFNAVFNISGEEQTQSIFKLAKTEGMEDMEALFTMHYGYTADVRAAFADWRH